MIKIMFVCLGNICRSPMAEIIMKDYVSKLGRQGDFVIQSAATSDCEVGNPIHRGTRRILDNLGLDYSHKRAVQLSAGDYKNYDYFIGMDSENRRDMLRLFNGDPLHKVSCLLDYTSSPRDVADPWYTGNFEVTYQDIKLGIECLYKAIINK